MTTFILVQQKREISPIAILVSFRGQKYRKCIGERVAVKQWNQRLKQVRETAANKDAQVTNSRLNAWRRAADKTVEHFKDYKATPTKEEFFNYLEAERWGKNNLDSTLILPYFDVFVSRYEGVRSVSQIKHYKGCRKTLGEYETFIGRPLRFDDIDMDFYNRFTAWFNTKGHSVNYLGEKIKILKVVLNDARDIDHLHTNTVYLSKQFETPWDITDAIYLNDDELMRIYHVPLNENSIKEVMTDGRSLNVGRKLAAMRKARDMFLIGAYTGLRFSDYSRLKPQNIQDGVIRIRNKKTGVTTAVPEHWVVKEIIDNGYDFDHPLFEQKLNYQIKHVAKVAGLTEQVLITKNVGGKVEEGLFEKYKLISSHTARRSFATNAYKAGIPTVAIMKITGHRRETTFLRYIRITDKENAELLKSSSFFSKPDEPNVEPNDSMNEPVSSKET